MRPSTAGCIQGWGSALPDRVLTNAELATSLDTTETWIVERTGIHQRRIGGSTSELATVASSQALGRAGWQPSSVDVLLLATTTPDRVAPATSARVHRLLGLGGGAVDVNAACSGFMYGLISAFGYLAIGAERVLLVGAETLSRITDWSDRSLAVLVGDGAGAVAISRNGSGSALLSWNMGCDGDAEDLLFCEIGGELQMQGREVFRRAVRLVADSAAIALADAGIEPLDISLVVAHQANWRIVSALCSRLGIPEDRAAKIIDRTGNTSAASIPMALADALESQPLERGDYVLFAGFGAGMAWASAVLAW